MGHIAQRKNWATPEMTAGHSLRSNVRDQRRRAVGMPTSANSVARKVIVMPSRPPCMSPAAEIAYPIAQAMTATKNHNAAIWSRYRDSLGPGRRAGFQTTLRKRANALSGRTAVSSKAAARAAAVPASKFETANQSQL
jgi:hypothetical protein